MKEEAQEEYRPQTGRMGRASNSNQANVQDEGHVVSFDDPHLHTAEGTKIRMPGAGVEHGGTINYEAHTRSDSNKE
jgi:hypothetical protein